MSAAFSCQLFHPVSQEPYNSAMQQTVTPCAGVQIAHPLRSRPQLMARSLCCPIADPDRLAALALVCDGLCNTMVSVVLT